ncbi:MAG: NAD-glutamate dehydrogenase [Rhizobiales bacterium]|nr:NAD-glutamate dehydrogenase [Hyphomicrobiales bacterium]
MAADDGLTQLVASTSQEAGSDGEKAFIRLLFEAALGEDLAPYAPADLAALAAGRLAFLRERLPGRAKVRVSNPPGAFSGVTFIDIANDDMPFLVDSTLALLNEHGFTITLVLHPILAVRRDAKGELLEILEKKSAAPGVIRESLMHIQIARLTDEAMPAQLQSDIVAVLSDVRAAVLDWQSMLHRLKDALAHYQSNPPPIPIEDLTESIAFLHWMADDHFTFLGMREYVFEGGIEAGELKQVPQTGLGVLRAPEIGVVRRRGKLVAMTPQIRVFFKEPDPLIITKADLRSQVHRRSNMDYVGLKLFGRSGELTGELRIVGLFTSSAYTQDPNEIPLLRRKLHQVIAMSGFAPSSHSGKALESVLKHFPRDELFQIDADTLAHIARGILRLEERPRIRLFVRRDRFDRYVSAFVFIPRDRFNTELRERVGALLAQAYDGRIVSFEPYFGEAMLVRVHFIVERTGASDVNPDIAALEKAIAAEVQTWEDRLESALRQGGADPARIAQWKGAFPPGYRATRDAARALQDIAELETLADDTGVSVEFVKPGSGYERDCVLRLYHRGPPVPLSRRLPILTHMGFLSIAETTHLLRPDTAGARFAVIHETLLESADAAPIDLPARAQLLESTFVAVWTGQAENDALNALTLQSGMAWRDIALLRAFGRYLRQTASSYSVEYLNQTLVKHKSLAIRLLAMFKAQFDPARRDEAAAKAEAAAIEAALDQVESLDEDRILRNYLNLVSAILRTNYFQESDGAPRPTISFKLDSGKIEALPEPKPFAEIFVYSPDVEAIHLRGGRIARGGIRWSDRPEDFRTEVLGLAKAQNVKNAVIVPVGAKGGFVPKKLPLSPREAIQDEAIRTYKLFISSLLDLTDNALGGRIEPPANTVRRDGDDPYLVVAADKGTASFSDIANALSESDRFWLGDAFASGGSAGYDHKKMGITARGAWEAVKRHFREADIDIQTTPFTVIGVGDMSGDVFGNGMLLSRQIRLVAAFDHRDIFIDPDPDPDISFKERERLFQLPRSSWQDYDKALLSPGGGIYSRRLKSIPLDRTLRELTGLARDHATPQELINALLKMKVDLLWFGGIGTYVKATGETNAECGDRSNDLLRVSAGELNARVIGEGANLAVTQRGRIEFAQMGGRINTDAVDNSAGVNSSDMEVNIKIALGRAEEEGRLTREARNALLAGMTDDVAALVLRNNYLQPLCLTLAVARGTEANGYAMQLMQSLERRGLLDRKLEFLPGDATVIERDARGEGLTRPEFAVLMAYAKIALHEDLLAGSVPDDPYFSRELFRYFPKPMQESYADEIASHKLRREIIATMLSNSMINRGGPDFVTRLAEETGAGVAEIAAAAALARDSFRLRALNTAVDELDNRIEGRVQTELYLEVQRLLKLATIWYLRHESLSGGLELLIARYESGIDEVAAMLVDFVPADAQAPVRERLAELEKAGVPAGLATRFAWQRHVQRAPDVVKIAQETGATIPAVGRALYASASDLAVDRLIAEGSQLAARDFVERQAINRLLTQVFNAHRSLVARAVTESGTEADKAWDLWKTHHAARFGKAQTLLSNLLAERSFTLARLTVAQGVLHDLVNAQG